MNQILESLRSFLQAIGLFSADSPPDDATIYLILMVVLLTIVLLILSLTLFGGGPAVSKRRLSRAAIYGQDKDKLPVQSINIRRKEGHSRYPIVDKVLQALIPRPERLRQRIERAGFEPNLGRLALMSFFLAISCFALLSVFTELKVFVNLLLGFAFGFSMPHIVLYFLQKRRQAKFIDTFPDAIDLMVRGLKAGLPITESIKNAGEEVANPVGEELTSVTDGVKLGGKLPEELQKAQARIGLQEFQFFTVALSIQMETGGNLSETLANLSDILRKRRQMKLKIKALSSEARASAYIIGSLPFIMFILIYLMNPGYAIELFTDPRGKIAVGIGLGMIALGCAVMYKMVKFEI